jgi:hypothetical protein
MTLTSTTKTKTNKTTTDAASRKRKADAAAPGSSEAKKPRVSLDTFFSPVVSSTVKKEANGKRDVSLSTEQIRVLRMVVEEEKNVFFTGSAGESCSVGRMALIGRVTEVLCYSKGRANPYYYVPSLMLCRRSTPKAKALYLSRQALGWQHQISGVCAFSHLVDPLKAFCLTMFILRYDYSLMGGGIAARYRCRKAGCMY